MKRSINNQLLSQLGAIHLVFYNLLVTSVFSWRFLFGPTYFWIAAFETYIANVWMTWGFLILAELALYR